jgi:hypothetical protein
MTGTIALTGPAETPGAPQLTAADLNTAINAALNTKAPLSAPVLVAPVDIGTGGATMTGPVLQGTGTANSTQELSIQNLSNGNAASSDLVITADNGDDTTNYVNLGINGSGYSQAAYNVGAAGDGYLYSASSHLAIGTATAAKIIRFHTGGTTTTQIRATITDTGINAAAIGTDTPAAGSFTTLAASGAVSGAGFTALMASPGAIGGTAASTGRFTTVTSTQATGTAPFTVASTTNVANLNASSLSGATFAAPGAIGGGTPGTGAFTTLSASSTVSGTGFSTYLASPPAIGGSAAAAGSFTTLSASSTVSGTGFSTYLASPPAIGGSAAAAGSFTTLAASSALTLSPPPAAVTGTTYTVGATDVHVVFNGSATCTVTLPTPASFTGRVLWIKTIAAFTVVSAGSNVQPRNSATAGTAILAAAAGNWAFLVCNGTNWIVMGGT